MKPKEKVSLSLIYVFISIYILINYRCTVSEILWTHKRAAKCAPRIHYCQTTLFSACAAENSKHTSTQQQQRPWFYTYREAPRAEPCWTWGTQQDPLQCRVLWAACQPRANEGTRCLLADACWWLGHPRREGQTLAIAGWSRGSKA